MQMVVSSEQMKLHRQDDWGSFPMGEANQVR
jgi:hypothetical protein